MCFVCDCGCGCVCMCERVSGCVCVCVCVFLCLCKKGYALFYQASGPTAAEKVHRTWPIALLNSVLYLITYDFNSPGTRVCDRNDATCGF